MIEMLLLCGLCFLVFGVARAAWTHFSWFLRNCKSIENPALIGLVDQLTAALNVNAFNLRDAKLKRDAALLTPDGRLLLARWVHDKYKAGDFTLDEVSFVLARATAAFALGHHNCALQREACGPSCQIMRGAHQGFGMEKRARAAYLASAGNDELEKRRLEILEADAFAIQLLMRARIDPFAALTYVEKMKAWRDARAAKQNRRNDWFGPRGTVSIVGSEERAAWIEAVIITRLNDEAGVQRQLIELPDDQQGDD